VTVSTHPPLAFVGGTGKLGRGLAVRLAAAGHRVLIGSRAEERAVDAAKAIRRRLEERVDAPGRVDGMRNAAAASEAGIVFLTLPFDVLGAFLTEHGRLLDGKIVVDVVNPLRFVDGRVELVAVAEGSAAMHIRRRAPGARIVSAFKNAAAAHLLRLERAVAGDVLLASDDEEAKAVVADLVRAIPALRPVDAGPLANAALLEAVTALELNVNRIHAATTTIQILGLDDEFGLHQKRRKSETDAHGH
jgi:NADPH-dependent F420 reductase